MEINFAHMNLMLNIIYKYESNEEKELICSQMGRKKL